MTYCSNRGCPIGLNAAPIGSAWASVKTVEHGMIFVGHQIVDGRQYCDPCAKLFRIEKEHDRMKYELAGKLAAMEKLK